MQIRNSANNQQNISRENSVFHHFFGHHRKSRQKKLQSNTDQVQ